MYSAFNDLIGSTKEGIAASSSEKKTLTVKKINGEIREFNGERVSVIGEIDGVISLRKENGKTVKIRLKNISVSDTKPEPEPEPEPQAITENANTQHFPQPENPVTITFSREDKHSTNSNDSDSKLILPALQACVKNKSNPIEYVEYIKARNLIKAHHYLPICDAFLHANDYISAFMFYERDIPADFQGKHVECFNLFVNHLLKHYSLKDVHLVSLLSKIYSNAIQASTQIHDEIHAKMLDVAALFFLIDDYASLIYETAMLAARNNIELIPKTIKAYQQSQAKRETLNQKGLRYLRQSQIGTRDYHMDFLRMVGLGSDQNPSAQVVQTPFQSNQTAHQRLSQFNQIKRPEISRTTYQPSVGRGKFGYG